MREDSLCTASFQDLLHFFARFLTLGVDLNLGGGQRGKRSDPDFDQVTAYIRKQTHQRAKIALLQEGRGREFSEFVEDLLANWLQARS